MGGQSPLKGKVQQKLVSLIWLIILFSVPCSMLPDDVDCIVYNEEFMECTWNLIGGKINYTLYYWYVSHLPQECSNYIQQDGYNIGCNFSASEIINFKVFKVFRNGSSDSRNITGEPKEFNLQDQVKPNPPGNLMVNFTESNGLLLTWEAPMSAKCLEYVVRHRTNKDKEWQKASISTQTNFNLPSVDPEKLFTFQVKSKINMYCGSSNLWSEWSLPVHWGKNDTQSENSKQVLHTYITVISLLGLMLLVVCLIKNESLKVIIVPKIPNPGRNFDSLFNNHNGNFQDWLGVSKDTLEGFKTSYHENVCIVSESPPDSTQSTIHGRSYEQLERTEIPGKASSPGNNGEVHPKITSPSTLFSDIAVFVESSRNIESETIVDQIARCVLPELRHSSYIEQHHEL